MCDVVWWWWGRLSAASTATALEPWGVLGQGQNQEGNIYQ